MLIWDTVVDKLLGTIPEQIGNYYREKQQLKQELTKVKLQGKIDLETAKAARKAAKEDHYYSWEAAYVALQQNSYKDEIVLGVFLWPFVGVFIPVVQDYVLTGFDYLSQVPYWWVGLAVAISLAIYGIRHKNANKIQAPGLRNNDVEVANDDE